MQLATEKWNEKIFDSRQGEMIMSRELNRKCGSNLSKEVLHYLIKRAAMAIILKNISER